MARAYIGIDNGSPWVVPSRDQTMFPSTKSSEGFLYVLMRMVAMGGQIRWMVCRAECLALCVFFPLSSNPHAAVKHVANNALSG